MWWSFCIPPSNTILNKPGSNAERNVNFIGNGTPEPILMIVKNSVFKND